MKELNYNIKIGTKNTIKALGYIQDASAKIYSLSDLTAPIWTGTVDSTGKVVDTYGNSPYLSYGDYRVVIEKCDYDTEISDFRVPDTSLVNLTIGCSSAITAHEIAYDHSLIGQSGGGLPSGFIMLYAGNIAPIGWLLCDGAAVSRTTYATLFAIIETAYGIGDGFTTFNVPDFLGRTVIGTGSGSGLTTRAIGNKSGTEAHIISVEEMAAHNHGSAGEHTHTIVSGPGTTACGLRCDISWNGPAVPTSSAGIHTHASVGSGMAHNNMQPFGVATYVIKT